MNNLFTFIGNHELRFFAKNGRTRNLLLVLELISFAVWGITACSSSGKTTLQGSEHIACFADVRYINHNVICEKEKRGNWVTCQVSGSIENNGTDRVSNVIATVEFGHELSGVRSSTFNILGDLDPGEQVDFKNGFFYYEPLTQYDIKVECDNSLNTQLSPTSTPRISFINAWQTDYVYTLAIDPANPTTLYAGTEAKGVFKTIDGGSIWSPSNAGLVNLTVGELTIDPLQPTVIYAGTLGTNGNNGAAYKSIDSGENWVEISNGMGGAYVYSLAINPFVTSTIYAGTSDGIFRSTDGGEEWTRLETGDPDPYIPQLILDPHTPTNLFAISSGTVQGILKSTNSGDDWRLIKPDFFYLINKLVIDPITPTILYAGTGKGVFVSRDSGETWIAINTGLGDYADVTAFVIDPTKPSTLYAAIRNIDVFITTNGGESWGALESNLGDVFIRELKLDPTNSANIYAITENGVFILGK